MIRNVYLEGELGNKFIPHFKIKCTKVADIFRCIDANYPDFKSYMIQKHEQGVGYHIEVAGNELENPAELLLEIKEGDIIVTPVPSGSKSGPLKILAAIALVVATGGMAASAVAAGAGTTAGAAAGAASAAAGGGMAGGIAAAMGGHLGWLANIGVRLGMGLAANLAIAGVQQMMAPDPATDADQEQSYLFNGAEQNIVEGDPVPVLYGRLRVPGQPISFEIAGANSRLGYRGLSGGNGGGGEGGGGVGPGTGPMPEIPIPEVPRIQPPRLPTDTNPV